MLAPKTIRWFPPFHQKIVKFSSVSSQFKERKLRVLDLDINYIETLGSSDNAHPIFFLPGLLGSIEMDFKPILPELNKQKYKWIAWDPPGFGKSRPPARPFRPAGYQCGHEVDVEYATELMRILGFEQYTIFGWSLGSITGIMMANQQPEKVSGLITMGAFGCFGPEMISKFGGLRKLGINGINKSRRTLLIEMYGEQQFRKIWDTALDELIEMCKSKVFGKGGTFEDIVKNVQCPTLVIHGTNDAVLDVSYGYYLNSMFPNARLHVVDKGTHNIHLLNTKEFVSSVEEFVDALVYNQKQIPIDSKLKQAIQYKPIRQPVMHSQQAAHIHSLRNEAISASQK